jgi:hypothetical protein
MIAVFEHPMSLIYNVAKSLVVNGVEILQYVEAAIKAY